ncbi:MAG: NAD(P)H-dependent oxidoreductase subunit E [Sphingomonadales bacterium]
MTISDTIGRTEAKRFSHPGKARHLGKKGKRTSGYKKGRQVDEKALQEIRSLIGDRPRRRDLLVEFLHLIQDEYHCLSPRHLAALAYEMRLAMAEVYEVATFYAHFDVVDDDQTEPAEITVRVCDSLTCQLMGAQQLLQGLTENPDQQISGQKVKIVRAPCMGRCDTAPVAEVGHNHIDHASPETVRDAVAGRRLQPEMPDYQDLPAYLADGGYKLLKACRDGTRGVASVIELLDTAGLRGLGGAGFPAARKWRFVRAEPGPRILVINADEGEPGTFKDRFYLEREPHRFAEGMLITAWAIEAEAAYIYLRDEYPAIRKILQREIEKLENEGIVKPGFIQLRRGAGAYICGEESAMLESIEGKRGLPRHKPPFPAQAGLFGRPTLIHNVETVYWLREIIEDGPEAFAAKGRNGSKGLRSFSVSGRVRSPGVKLAPAGITARQLIDQYCGGIADGHEFKAYLPGGASGGILPATLADVPLDFGTLEKHGCFLGSAAVIVLSDQDNMRDVALNLLRFFEDESCGQCSPCRLGTEKAVKLMGETAWDETLLSELVQVMRDASICGLGQAAGNPIASVLEHFKAETGADSCASK